MSNSDCEVRPLALEPRARVGLPETSPAAVARKHNHLPVHRCRGEYEGLAMRMPSIASRTFSTAARPYRKRQGRRATTDRRPPQRAGRPAERRSPAQGQCSRQRIDGRDNAHHLLWVSSAREPGRRLAWFQPVDARGTRVGASRTFFARIATRLPFKRRSSRLTAVVPTSADGRRTLLRGGSRYAAKG